MYTLPNAVVAELVYAWVSEAHPVRVASSSLAHCTQQIAHVVKLVDAKDSKSFGEIHVGSSPTVGTQNGDCYQSLFLFPYKISQLFSSANL